MTPMARTIENLSDLLNRYANLLLAAITAAYVWLTWRNVKALREASLREREAQHLQEIKDNVAQPILSWIDETIGQSFTGRSPEILSPEGGYDGIPRRLSHTIGDPFLPNPRLRTLADSDAPDPLTTWTSLRAGRISKFLYDHAKCHHFPDELRQFDSFLDGVRQLTGDLVAFANECAKSASNSEIPIAAQFADENSMPEVASPTQLVADCVQSFLQGRTEPVTCPQELPTSFSIHSLRSRLIAKARVRDKAEHWVKSGMDIIRKRWDHSKLPERVRKLLSNADLVRQEMQHILFTQSLDDCELISGAKRNRWPWTRLASKKPTKFS